ncbi:hypothetical protein F5X98DRAFT_391821 [Xylaria grammica]|nr:hypothetical protein F5X98DRAFT_391821 [Xylaria grammica]
MSDQSQYQGSQAYARDVAADESITPNCGSASFSKTLINLRGKLKSIDLTVKASFTSNTTGSFGLPANWGLDISYTIPGESLTVQGKTFVVDPDWSDETGWRSGLRYVNHHGMLFEEIFPPLPLPSGRSGYYAWRLRMADGALEFFDDYGKLLEHDDIYGNSIYYSYIDPASTLRYAMIDYIIDSWGQKITFHNVLESSLAVVAPDGGKMTLIFGYEGVNHIQDASGYITSFDYTVSASQTVIHTITYPTGLQSIFEYVELSAFDGNGNSTGLPACSRHLHMDATGTQMAITEYIYGEATGYANFTGNAIGCSMGSSNDSLMDSNDQDYRYDVIIRRLDKNQAILQMSRIYYNYLHLSMKEEHYLVDANGKPVPAYCTENTYRIPIDEHARATSYSQPIQVDHLNYHQSDSTYKPLRRTTAAYDDFGCPLKTSEYLWDASQNEFVLQQSVINTYSQTSWGGEMMKTETFVDHLLGNQKLILHKLTPDQRNFGSSITSFRESSSSSWSPWKTKLYSYDTCGRITSETIAWSEGANVPRDSVARYTNMKTYRFNQTTGILTESRTDPLGNTGSLDYDMRIMCGPLVRKTSPLGIVESLDYDLSGRLSEVTDALGYSTKTMYLIGPSTNQVQSTNSVGYTTTQSHDALGRTIEIADVGIEGPSGINRILSRYEYNFVSKVVKSTSELGLVQTQAYDALGRVIQNTDRFGNVTTYVHKDADLVTEVRLNGDLRRAIFADGLARTVKTVSYEDSGAVSLGYQLVSETAYDGFGRIRGRTSTQQAADGSRSIILSRKETELNVEDKPQKVTTAGLASTLAGRMDQVVREFTYDIFGNSITYRKTVTYGDGRQFCHDGPISTSDACNRMVKLQNQLGQSEISVYNADGHKVSITRYDGTVFSYTYDALGQELTCTSPDGTTFKEWLPNGLLSKMSTGGSTISYVYAIDGSLKTVVYPSGATQSYMLDKFSRVSQEVDAAGRVTVNSFDSFGRLASKTQDSNNITYEYGIVNHSIGELTGHTVTSSRSYRRSISYNSFGWRSKIVDRDLAGELLLSTSHHYDSRGRLIKSAVSSSDPKDTSTNYQDSIQYDGLGQLSVKRIRYATGTSPSRVHSFLYDGNFNILQSTENGATSYFKYNEIDQRIDSGFVYDTNGRLLTDSQKRKYTYNSVDKLLSVTSKTGTTSYQYHPNNALSKMSKNGASSSYYHNLGAVNSVLESDGKTRAWWTSYFLGPQGPILAQREKDGAIVFLESRNSTVMVLGSTETTTYAYDSYGNTASAAPRFGWQQELSDPEEGLVYLRSRFYQPDNMSFLTMDGSPDQENRYAYCKGDPINASDPDGHSPSGRTAGGTVAGAIVGALVTALAGYYLSEFGIGIGIATTVAGIGAASLTGAAGNIAGDATSALIQGERFTAARAGEDFLSGAIGGAVGAGSGGLAGRTAMRMALNASWTFENITRIGTFTSSVIGGGIGGLAASETSASLHHQPLFSIDTALSAITGFAGGLGGALVSSGVARALGSAHDVLPVEMTKSDLRLIVKGVSTSPRLADDHNMYAMSAPRELCADLKGAASDMFQTLGPGGSGKMHRIIIAHGDGDILYATVRYGPRIVYRPIDPTLLGEHIAEDENFGMKDDDDTRKYTNHIKLIICRAAYSTGPKLARALGRPVWATYEIASTRAQPRWYKFK